MPRVFLSYRREDASGHAGRLYDLLAARYGAAQVFMDIDAIPLGSEFRETINRAVASCDVLIALIGRDWLDARDADGRRRLDDRDDFVRREIEAALAAGLVVVPASVQGAEFPQAGALPESLGSNLRAAPGSDRWYCTGSGAESDPCSFVLTALPEPDLLLRAPFDGVVTGWRVHEGGGPMRLIVVRGEFRPGERSTLTRVDGSDEEQVSGDKGQPFRTRPEMRRGDGVGLQFSVRAYGNAPYSDGTWLEEWLPPLATEPRRADDSSSTTYQLLYNATVERDRDRDGYGDATQDDCPKDPGRHAGC
jgi:TIR domain